MTALDIIVLFLIGAGAIFGFMRGFVQEALSLIAWLLIIAAIRLHLCFGSLDRKSHRHQIAAIGFGSG
jgi:uncharacterized membrane protein required for colicin V production